VKRRQHSQRRPLPPFQGFGHHLSFVFRGLHSRLPAFAASPHVVRFMHKRRDNGPFLPSKSTIRDSIRTYRIVITPDVVGQESLDFAVCFLLLASPSIPFIMHV